VLPKKHKIQRPEFRDTLSKGRTYHAPHMSLRVAKGGGDGPKFAVVVSRKVAPTAVKRNLLRRRCFAAIKRHLAVIEPATRGAVYPKKGADALSFTDIDTQLADLLRAAGIARKGGGTAR
jgi:ribonuclease P protein component